MVNHVFDEPFYPLTLIQALVEADHFSVVNDRADRWLEDLGWDAEMLKQFILALTADHFHGRYPQCTIGNGTRKIDCDAYKMKFDENNLIEDASCGTMLFTKLAISKNSRTLVVSFHLDGSIG